MARVVNSLDGSTTAGTQHAWEKVLKAEFVVGLTSLGLKPANPR